MIMSTTTFTFAAFLLIGSTMAISVQCPSKRYVVILFQPVTLTCNYQTSSTQPPVVTWKYKSFCRDPIQAALNPSSAENAISQVNPNYNPNIECSDSARTIRIVASKQGSSVTLGNEYQARKISIINDADLNIAQTAWGDSGVYVCSVISSLDLTGNSEDYTELIVLDWLLVVLVVLGFLLLLLFIAICWCQCCPHTCCCYVSCPCCPERCCCPRALYEAGKAVKSGVPSHYAPTLYAPSMYAQPPYGGAVQNPIAIPLLPQPINPVSQPNGYGRDYDGASSVGQGSQVPLLNDQDSGGNTTRSGYRIQANPDGNATRVLYYMERELANLDPTRPVNSSGNYHRLDGMSEVSSLHEDLDPRTRGRSQPPPLATVFDQDENMSTISSVSQQGRRDDYARRGGVPSRGYMATRGRARSVDNLDDVGRGYRDRDDYPLNRREGGARGGRRGSDDEWSSSGRSDYNRYDRNRRDYLPDDRCPGGGYQGRRSRSRDDLMELERDHGRGGHQPYDDSFLKEALQRKKMGEQHRTRSRDRLDSESDRSERSRGGRGPPPLPLTPPSSYPDRRPHNDMFPPPPPPYSEDESVASSKKSNLRKNGAVSRESLVV
ncbi:lipolysis-stimulated lipoprotein receptor isoform X2 [Scleropages formosus]|uniref:Lipolysis stimulated lipoprotein receptor n=1 Tax=Scleropages formosus TaxID=113540 RepID=A0A8C9T5D8_SCLFO|nr:lipolysis-stimulated lipoprotein receptor-like isoform X2 [Scleropages formosus]